MWPLSQLVRALTLLLVSLAIASVAAAQAKPSSEAGAAKRIAEAVRAAGLQKVLVVDFLDSTGTRSEQGVYLAAGFAKALKTHATGVATADRWAWFSLLEKKTVAPGDVEQPAAIQRICAALGCDAIVSGRWARSVDELFVSLTLRSSATGQPIASAGYQGVPGPAALVHATSDPTGIRFYFPGLDGLSQPVCKSCPDPSYTDRARKKHIRGVVIYSVLLGTDGRLGEFVLLRSLEKSLDRSALETLKHWELQPVRDPSGQLVPVRVPIEVNFKLQ